MKQHPVNMYLGPQKPPLEVDVGRSDIQVVVFAMHDIYLFYRGIKAVYIVNAVKSHAIWHM